jgi:hypothetical protein
MTRSRRTAASFSALDAALGEHGPWDEAATVMDDPEHLGDWRFAYVIEAIGSVVPAT